MHALFWLLAFQVIWIAAESRCAPRTGSVPDEDRSFLVAHVTVLILINGIAIVEAWWIDTVPFGRWLCGILIGSIALALRCWSIRTLGRRFRDTIDREAGHVWVTTGPYRFSDRRWLRHPGEWGFLGAFFGLCALSGGSVAMMGFFLLVLPFSLWRMILEDRAFFS